MVASSVVVVSVAKISAEFWQHVACLPEHVSSSELLDLIFCLPLHQLGRLAICLWTFFCLPPSLDSSYYYYYHSDNDNDNDNNNDNDDSSRSSSSYYYVDDRAYNSHSD